MVRNFLFFKKTLRSWNHVIPKTLSLIALLFLFQSFATAKDKITITGIVLSAEDNEPVVGATISAESGKNGTATNIDGRFSLKVRSGSTIEISYIGLNTYSFTADAEKEYSITMKPNPLLAIEGELVVIGYGVVKKSDLTGSVASINANDLAKIPSSSLGDGLSGRVAGVTVQSTTGEPGSNPVIRIRGGNSILGNNDPLFVVDGFVSVSGASGIHPDDIQSMEILKDASATSIYGAKGANGVIIITTKKGSKSKEKLDIRYSGYYGIQNISNPIEMMNPTEYIAMMKEYYRQLNQTDTRFENAIAAGRYSDWIKEATQTGSIMNHFVSISGKGNKSSYGASLEYLKQEGIIKKSGYERFNIRLYNDFNLINNQLQAGFQLSFRHTSSNKVPYIFFNLYDREPIFPIYKEDGKFNNDISLAPKGLVAENPIEKLMNIENSQKQNFINATGYLEWQIIKDLYYKGEANVGLKTNFDNSFTPSTVYQSTSTGSKASSAAAQNISYEFVNTLRYAKKIDTNNKIDGTIGMTVLSTENYNFSANGGKYPTDIFSYYNLGGGDPLFSKVSSDFTDQKMISYLARFNYNLKEKYLFTVAGRADGSSKFGINNRWAYFPSGAFAWRANEEAFVKKMNVFSNLKFRTSFGLSGSEALDPYQTIATMSTNKAIIGGREQIGFVTDKIPNDDLKWETTSQFDFGIDMGVLKNRLRATIDLYYKKTFDLLVEKKIPSTTGFPSMVSNIGNVENKGLEIELSADALQTEKLAWTTSFNIGFNKNKVLSLGTGEQVIYPDVMLPEGENTANTIVYAVGKPLGGFNTYVFDGIYQNRAEIENTASRLNARPGDQRVMDLDGNGIIDSNDKTITGNALPDFTFGFNNEFTINKVWNVSFFFQGTYGNEILNFTKYLLEIETRNRHKELIGYWTGEGSTNTIPAPSSNPMMSSRYIEDGSYIRLKNLTVSYNLPKEFLRKMKIANGSVYLSGTDLLTFTKYTGENPEVNYYGSSNTALGVDYNSYPSSSTYNVGLKLNF